MSGITVTGADFSLSAGTLLPLVLQPGAGSPIVAAFTFAPTTAGAKTAQMSFVDDASSSPQTFTLSGTGFTGFGLNMLVPGTDTQTVTAGQGIDYQLQLLGAAIPPGPAAFNGVVSFSCSNLPPGANCTFSPASASLQSNVAEFADINLAVSTTASFQAASLHPPGLNVWYTLAPVFALVLGASRRSFSRVPLFLCFIILIFTVSCGGGSKVPPPSPTPAGTFTFTVNATSNNVTHSKNLVLIVK